MLGEKIPFLVVVLRCLCVGGSALEKWFAEKKKTEGY